MFYDTDVLWSAPSFLQKLHRMSLSLNSGIRVGISFGSDESSTFRLLVLLKGKDHCWLLYLPIIDFATKTLKSSKEIELPRSVYTMWLWTMAMSMRSKNILKQNLNLLLQSSQYAAVFWSITSTPPMLTLYILIIFGHDTGVFVAEPLVGLITFDVPSIPSIFVANKRTGLLSNHLKQMTYHLKWRNMGSIFYSVIVLDHMFYKTTIYVLHKI